MDQMTDAGMLRKQESGANQSGFTLVETMISTIILAGGLLALASAFAQGMVAMSTSHSHEIAKQEANEAVESVNTARDTRIITWAQIRNVSNGGVFLDGAQPERMPGPDGLVNTVDDGAVEVSTSPGPDAQLGTGDDVVLPLSNFTRQIEITDVSANLRQVRVTIRYQIGHLSRQYQLITFISSFA